jgi:drug/metabolite transporter (DMT)-like permease
MQKPAPPPAPGHAAPRPPAAIILMCLTCAFFACLDTTAKYLGAATGLPMMQVVWMRFLSQLVSMVALLGLLAVPDLLRTRKPGLQIVRSFLLLGSTACNFMALRTLRLDQAQTIGFLTPLTVALLAGPLLGEWIGWRRSVAIAIGFLGALVAIRPGVAGVSIGVLWAFGTMLSLALFGVITRHLAAYDLALVTLFYSLFAGTLVIAPFALAEWAWPDSPFVWMLLLSMGLYGGLGHYTYILAHRYAPASTVAPFLYVALLTHSTGGYLVFGQTPDRWTLAGAAIVIATGLYLLHREHITARAAAVAMTSEAAAQR